MAGLNHTYHFKIKTLSPISVGNEQEAVTSFSEYIYDNDYLYYLDLNRLKGIDNAKIDAFIQGMDKGMQNNSYRDNFSKLVKDTLEVDIETLMTGEKYRIRGLEPEHSLSLRGLLKTRNRPYISGSTMKGAIKSAILYNWLMSDGKKHLREFVNFINSTYNRVGKDIVINNEKIFSSNLFSLHQKSFLKQPQNNAITNFYQLARSQKRFDEEQNEILGVSRKALKKAKDNIEQEFTNTLEAQLFQSKKPTSENRPDASFLRVIDSPSIDNQSIVIESMKRVNIYNEKSKEEAIPFLVETIEADTLFDFQIQIPSNSFKLNQVYHPSLKFLQSKEMYKSLFKILNRFSEDFIKEELNITSNVILKSFYEDLESEMAGAKEAIMRIGFGKHFLNTSMALAVKQEDHNVYVKLLELMMESEKPDDFPTTRTLTSDNQPLGWIKLSFASEKHAIIWQKI